MWGFNRIDPDDGFLTVRLMDVRSIDCLLLFVFIFFQYYIKVGMI